MKRTSLTCLLLFSLVFLNRQAQSAQCSGGGDVYVCGHMEFLTYAQSAFQNCCAGSVVHTVDICGGDVRVDIVVNFDGPNSSC